MAAKPTPLDLLRVTRRQIPSHGLLPNSSVQQRPLLIYREAFDANVSAAAIEQHLMDVGAVVPQWRYSMYTTTHYHSTTHELLCISKGKARLCFGGENNPDRFEPVVSRGDVILIPAGVAHRLLEVIDGGFEMVGSYPPGKNWDMCYGTEEEKSKQDQIKALPWFSKDPIYGDEGPALDDNST